MPESEVAKLERLESDDRELIEYLRGRESSADSP